MCAVESHHGIGPTDRHTTLDDSLAPTKSTAELPILALEKCEGDPVKLTWNSTRTR